MNIRYYRLPTYSHGRVNRRGPRELDFSPRALEILERPTSPIKIGLIYAISGFLIVSAMWSYFGYVDVYAIAPGKIEPIGRSKVIQPTFSGRVTAVRVVNGQHVKVGEALIEVDPTEAEATREAAREKLIELRAEVERRRLEITIVKEASIDTGMALSWSKRLLQQTSVNEEEVFREDVIQLAAALNHLAAQKHEKEVEKEGALFAIAAQKALIEILVERTSMRETLADRNVGSRANVLDALQEQRQAEASLTTMEQRRAEAIAELGVMDTESAELRQRFTRDNMEKIEDAESRVEALEQDMAKASMHLACMTLRSPVDGIVQALAINTIGQFIGSGQDVMDIVPDNMPLEIAAYVMNRDIGFVAERQNATIKIDAFPFMRYGVLRGFVKTIARDAVPEAEALQGRDRPALLNADGFYSSAAAGRSEGFVFPVVISLPIPAMKIAKRSIMLSAGMTVTVDILTEHRRIIDYIISPLKEIGYNALRER